MMSKPFSNLSVIAIVGAGLIAVGDKFSVGCGFGVAVAVSLVKVGSAGGVASGTTAVQAARINWQQISTIIGSRKCFSFKYASHEREWMGVEPTSALSTRH